jgi:hypothetical protein
MPVVTSVVREPVRLAAIVDAPARPGTMRVMSLRRETASSDALAVL